MTLAGRGWHGGGGGHLTTTELGWVLGVMLLVVGVGLVLVAVRNATGRGYYGTRRALGDYARRTCGGDVDRAAALVRSGFPVALTVLALGADLIVLAVVGFRELPAWPFWPAPAGLTLACLLWIVAERELALPGVLVPVGARGTRGLWAARRARQASGRPT